MEKITSLEKRIIDRTYERLYDCFESLKDLTADLIEVHEDDFNKSEKAFVEAAHYIHRAMDSLYFPVFTLIKKD